MVWIVVITEQVGCGLKCIIWSLFKVIGDEGHGGSSGVVVGISLTI